MLVLTIVALLFLLPVFSALPAKGKPKQDPLLETYRSPLDQDDAYYDTDENLDISSLPSINQLPTDFLFSNFGKVPLCQKECIQKFAKIMNSAFKAPNHYHRFEGVCNNFNDTLACMTDAADLCVNQEPFDVLTSGLYYMCVDQRKAFEVVIECVDAQAYQVQTECEDQCHTKTKLANWAVQSGLLDAFMHGAALRGGGGGFGNADRPALKSGMGILQGLNQVNPKFTKQVVQEGCELASCTLGCLKAKFDAKCEGSAGALLSEAFVRPIAEAQKLMGLNPMSGLLHAFMPKQCDFMLNSEGLDQFRINPELDETLKKMYALDASQNQSPDPGFIDSAMTATEDVDGMMQQLNNPASVDEDYPDLGVSSGAEELPSDPSFSGDNSGSPADNTANVGNQGSPADNTANVGNQGSPAGSTANEGNQGNDQLEDDYIHTPLGNPLDMDY